MSVSFQCPSCQATHTLADQLVGRRYRCPDCDALVDVPIEAASSPAPPKPKDRERWKQGRPRNIDSSGLAELPSDEPLMLDVIDVVSADVSLPAMGATPPMPPLPPPPKFTKDEDEAPPPIRKSRLADTEMDMTPMVDVTFQLLIFFMITAAFALQKAKEIPKPQEKDPSSTPVVVEPDQATDLVVVKIDENNTFTVINTDGDEDEAPSVQDLYIKLKRAKTGGSSGTVPTKMRVVSHGDALHEKVVAALDAGNETGFAEIELATASDDEE